MDIDRALFLSITVALGAATSGCSSDRDGEPASSTEEAATSADCTAATVRPGLVDEHVQGFRYPAPIDEGWADEVPLARYYDAIYGRYTTTWALPYREIVLSGRPVAFAPSGKRAFEFHGTDASGHGTLGVWWIEYDEGDRGAIAIRAYEPAQIAADDYACFAANPVRRSTCRRGSLLPPSFGVRPSPVLPTPGVTLPYGYTRAPCAVAPPLPAWSTCAGGFAIRTDPDPAVFWLRLPDGTTTKVRRTPP